MIDNNTYHSPTPSEMWQRLLDYRAGKRREPETVGEWKQNLKKGSNA